MLIKISVKSNRCCQDVSSESKAISVARNHRHTGVLNPAFVVNH